jgi:hypothetical protein
VDDWPGRGARRAAEVAGVAAATRGRITGWLAARRADPLFGRFANHLATLDTVLIRMLDAVDVAVAGLEPDTSSGETYRRCREIERGIVRISRLFDWYAAKYDQRLESGLGDTLRAADELVRGCWSPAFAALGGVAPAGPLPYLDAAFDAFATPRRSVPSDLRAPADETVAACVKALPIPTIALPAHAADRGWWLVLAAHETGHHVYEDLALEAAVTDAVAERAPAWLRWRVETFADVYATLMVGPTAASWAVGELQHAEPVELARSPAARYPAPVTRLAVIGETARAVGVSGSLFTAEAATDWCRAHEVSELDDVLATVPDVVEALVGLPVGDTTLGELSGVRSVWFADDGRVAMWTPQLRHPKPMIIGRERPEAARLAIAAGVAAYDALGGAVPDLPPANEVRRLHTNLVTLLATCGPSGTLAPTPPAPAVDRLADDLTERLLGLPAPARSGGGP